jgi:hypothetical protein
MSIALKINVGLDVLVNTFSLFFAQVYLYKINVNTIKFIGGYR